MILSELCQVIELEEENARIKRIAADQPIAIAALKCGTFKELITLFQKEQCLYFLRKNFLNKSC